MKKCGKVKHPCKICFQTVTAKNGLQCQGACQKWAHYKCLNYTPGKIQDIKAGLIRVNCPCPNCDTQHKEVQIKPYVCSKEQCPANKKPVCDVPQCPKNKPSCITQTPWNCPDDCPSVSNLSVNDKSKRKKEKNQNKNQLLLEEDFDCWQEKCRMKQSLKNSTSPTMENQSPSLSCTQTGFHNSSLNPQFDCPPNYQSPETCLSPQKQYPKCLSQQTSPKAPPLSVPMTPPPKSLLQQCPLPTHPIPPCPQMTPTGMDNDFPIPQKNPCTTEPYEVPPQPCKPVPMCMQDRPKKLPNARLNTYSRCTEPVVPLCKSCSETVLSRSSFMQKSSSLCNICPNAEQASKNTKCRQSVSDSEILNGCEARQMLLGAIEQICCTVGQFSLQFKELMSKMMAALEKCSSNS